MSERRCGKFLAISMNILGIGILSLKKGSEAQIPSAKSTPTGFIVYSKLMYGNPEKQDRSWGYDLFLHYLPNGKPIQLTNHRNVSDLGGNIEAVAIDATGNYVAFRANRHTKAATGQPLLLWIYNLHKHTYSPISLPGSVDAFHWSPRGSTLAVELHKGIVHQTVLYDPKAGKVKKAIDKPNFRFWAWWGTGKGIVADQADPPGPPVLLSSGGEKVLFRWKLPTQTDVLSVVPSPDGKHMLIKTPDYLYDAPPGHPWKKLSVPFRNLPEAQFFWSPDSQYIAYDGVSYAITDPPSATLPDKHHMIGIGNTHVVRWNHPVFGWKEDNADSSDYSLLDWSHNDRWLLVMQQSEKKGSLLLTLWAWDINTRAKTPLFSSTVMLNSIDWHEQKRPRSY